MFIVSWRSWVIKLYLSFTACPFITRLSILANFMLTRSEAMILSKLWDASPRGYMHNVTNYKKLRTQVPIIVWYLNLRLFYLLIMVVITKYPLSLWDLWGNEPPCSVSILKLYRFRKFMIHRLYCLRACQVKY